MASAKCSKNKLKGEVILITLLKQYKVIAIVGMGKNVGKTTTLNYLISRLDKLSIGLTSIGYDGEALDTITAKPKPQIWVRTGTIFATAKTLLPQLNTSFHILEETNMSSPLGNIIIAQALSSGNIELAGPSKKTQIKDILERFWFYKVDKCLIDGAFGKMMSTDSFLADATILATGLSYHGNIDKIISDTIYRVSLYAQDNLISKEEAKINISLDSVLGNEKELALLLKDNDVVDLQGALTDRFLNELIFNTSLRQLKLILANPTMCFVSYELAKKAAKRAISIHFLEANKIIAITINPTSPSGEVIDSDDLKQKLGKQTKIPIFDVLRGEE